MLPRRKFLIAALAGLAMGAGPRLPRAATTVLLPSDANRRFSIYYKGDKIGTHRVRNSLAGGESRVDTEIDMRVKALFFTLFCFSHRSEEIWRNGMLVSLQSDTPSCTAISLLACPTTTQSITSRSRTADSPMRAATASLPSRGPSPRPYPRARAGPSARCVPGKAGS